MMSRLAGVLVALGGLIPLFSTRYSPISFFNPHEQAFGIRADKDRDTFDLDRVDRELQLKRAKGKGKSNSSIKPWWEQPTRKGVNFQPQVTVVESAPETKSFGSLSLPYGSKWCDGKPTYWMIGHQKDDEEPLCEVEPGKWERLGKAILDVNDELNAEDSNAIDRHDCVTMDVNHDGAEDIICGVGANKGTGYGYNELYLTQDDGTLKKIPSGHGLQEYNTMRNRLSTTLKGLDGVEYVFFATKGVARRDGRYNVHRMFQNVYESEEIMPYFKEVKVSNRLELGHSSTTPHTVRSRDHGGISFKPAVLWLLTSTVIKEMTSLSATSLGPLSFRNKPCATTLSKYPFH